MQKCLFSRHIPKVNTDAKEILSDISVFNKAKHAAFVMTRKEKEVLKSSKETDKPDMRLKANRELHQKEMEESPSIHLRLKKKYGLNDYFANSARKEASAALKSVLELQKADISEKEKTMSSVSKKIKHDEKRLAQLEKTRNGLIALSKWKKAGGKGRKPRVRMPKGNTITIDRETEAFTVWKPSYKGKRVPLKVYDDPYRFETGYLCPAISSLKHRIHLLKNKENKLQASIDRMKTGENDPSVCFGSKALFRKQDTVYKEDHDAWKNAWTKKRNSGMTISGRKDSRDGNYVFSYDPDDHVLTYKSISGKAIKIPDVVFPYGQWLLDRYVRKQREENYAPVAWRIEDHGGSFIIKCILTIPDDGQKNYYYGDGCIGLDMNVGLFALTETDGKGNLISHKIIPFDLTGLSTYQAEQVLSAALEKVFIWCFEKKKPLVIENLKDVATTDHYGNKDLNRKLSGFAHTKITELVMSKSFKYRVDVKKVNPAFTSQMGKVKYMSRYGLSVHESAAMVIARRGMGYKEKLPRRYFISIPDEKKKLHHWSHWRYLHKNLKETRPVLFYINHRKIH